MIKIELKPIQVAAFEHAIETIRLAKIDLPRCRCILFLKDRTDERQKTEDRGQRTEDGRQMMDEATSNEKLLQGPGTVFSKRVPGRRRHDEKIKT